MVQSLSRRDLLRVVAAGALAGALPATARPGPRRSRWPELARKSSHVDSSRNSRSLATTPSRFVPVTRTSLVLR